MKKLLISLLFLFSINLYSAAQETRSNFITLPNGSTVLLHYFNKNRKLKDDERQPLLDIDKVGYAHSEIFYSIFESTEKFLSQESTGNILWIITDSANNKPIAFTIFNKEDPNTLVIQYLLVDPIYQGKRIETTIIDSLFKKLSPAIINLTSVEKAVGFYTKLGFKKEAKGSLHFYKENPYL